jgi:hypothetical protein
LGLTQLKQQVTGDAGQNTSVMKTTTKTPSNSTPDFRKPSLLPNCISAAMTLLVMMCLQAQVLAQSDDFNDGNDTTPLAWTHYDAISTIFGGGAQDTWTFPGGNTYRLQAVPSGDPGTAGPARVSSFPTNIYTDFYAAVDVVGWDNSYSQAIGLLGRAGSFGSFGFPTTRGYMFIYVNGAASAGTDNYIAIARLQNDAQTCGVPGSSTNTAEVHGVNLDPSNKYRFVFMAKGTHLEGRVYQLPDVHTPIALVSANTAGDSVQHTSGKCGLLVFNVADGFSIDFAGPADVTFDNYAALPQPPDTSFADDFNDGNDTAPLPGWLHEDTIATAGLPGGCYAGATFTFPSGGYRLFSPAPCVTAAGGPRVSSLRGESVWSDFYISVDVLNWDNTVRELFGIAARINTPGLSTTGGYLLSWEEGSAALPNTTGGDFDLLRIQGEGATADQMESSIPGQNSGMHLTNGVSYRFVYIAKGFNFEARIYQLPDTTTPVKRLFAIDTFSMFPNGYVGVIVADHPADSPPHACWATFDNFYVAAAEPRLAFDRSSGNAAVSWSASLDGIWVLETSSRLDFGAVWTEITADQITFLSGQRSHMAATPMASNADTYYRLRRL